MANLLFRKKRGKKRREDSRKLMERETDRQTETERETQTDRQTNRDRQTDRETSVPNWRR